VVRRSVSFAGDTDVMVNAVSVLSGEMRHLDR
jgi:hypothetical protein